MNVIKVIQVIMLISIVFVGIKLVVDYRKNKEPAPSGKATIGHYLIGFLTNFFDTLGIGSFATTMTSYRLTRLVPDELIPGTLNVGDCVPVLCEALLFLGVINIDPLTIGTMLAAGIVGSIIGVRIENHLNINIIRVIMGIALAVAALSMILSQLNVIQAGGTANGLTGYKLAIGIASNFVLGILLPLGIGNYAPCMVIVYLLGMSADMAFPIMMSSGALVLVSSSLTFIPTGHYHRRGALALTLAGVLGVFCAVYLVKSLPIYVLKWIVVIVVIYTSITLFRDSVKKSKPKEKASAEGKDV